MYIMITDFTASAYRHNSDAMSVRVGVQKENNSESGCKSPQI